MASTFLEGSNDGVMNGATPVTVAAAPSGTTKRVVTDIAIYNADTAAVTLTVRLVSSGNNRKIWSGSLAIGATWQFRGTKVLDVNKRIEALLSGAAATTNPDFTADWADHTP